MRATAEVRWFLAGPIPDHVAAWFAGLAEGEPTAATRTDRYLCPTGPALNVKLREGQLEVKRRDAEGMKAALHPRIIGQEERWRKWSFAVQGGEAANDERWLAVAKTRRLLAYQVEEDGQVRRVSGSEAPASGCEVELSQVEAGRQVFWSLCFESYGDEDRLHEMLHRTAAHVFHHGDPPSLASTDSFSYPAWLMSVSGEW